LWPWGLCELNKAKRKWISDVGELLSFTGRRMIRIRKAKNLRQKSGDLFVQLFRSPSRALTLCPDTCLAD
jgi:hypothetical protein